MNSSEVKDNITVSVCVLLSGVETLFTTMSNLRKLSYESLKDKVTSSVPTTGNPSTNDLPLYLMNDFERDYKHGRKNLGEVIHKIKIANMLPKIKFLHFYEFIKDKLFGTGNVRNDVLRLITKSKIDYTNKYKDFKTPSDALQKSK